MSFPLQEYLKGFWAWELEAGSVPTVKGRDENLRIQLHFRFSRGFRCSGFKNSGVGVPKMHSPLLQVVCASCPV